MFPDRLKEITNELKSLGYYDFQVKDMLRECTGKRSLENVKPEDEQMIIEYLEKKLDFARKCMDID